MKNPEQEGSIEPLTLEKVVGIAQETLLQEGEHLPTLVVEGKQGTATVVLAEFGASTEERAAQLFRAGAMLSQREELGGLQQVFLVTEAWMSAAREGKLPELPPSQDPERREVLIITHLDASQIEAQAQVAIREILRDESGELRELAPREEWEGAEVKSPLLAAFVLGYATGLQG